MQDDSVLVSAYIAGDEKALQQLIDRHNLKISNFIFSKIQDRATTEDIFQETFIKVIRTLKRGKYVEEGKFVPWVMRIAHNLIIDHFRRNKKMPKFEGHGDFNIFTVMGNGELDAESQIIKEQIESDVVKLIALLPADQQEVVNMRIYGDMSFKEIADATEVSINTALGRMRYALINLRKMIEENQIVLTK